MTRPIILFIPLLCAITGLCRAQTLTGKIVDDKQSAIEGATVILQLMDSTYVDAAITEVDGTFLFNKAPQRFRLIVQHLLFQTRQLTADTTDVGIIRLEPKHYSLDEIVLTGEKPLVKVSDGRLSYSLPDFSKKQIATNAYEAISKLPGIQEHNGELSLAGAGNLTILVDGHPSTMTPEQVKALLRNTPAGHVSKVEIMYSAPPEYHIRGAAVNVVMKRPHDNSFQGELNAHYQNKYFNSGGTNANFRYSTSQMAFDVMYSADNIKTMEYTDLYSKHTFAGEVHDISQNEQLRAKHWTHSIRAALEYALHANSHLNLAYTGSFTPNQHNNSIAKGNFQESNLDKFMDSKMHNASIQFTSNFGLKIGGDYTNYTSYNDQQMRTTLTGHSKNAYTLHGGQRINRYSIFVDQTHNLARDWKIGYGTSFRYVNDNDYQTYQNVQGNVIPQDMQSEQNEQTTNLYVSLSKNWKNNITLSLSATGEYYSINDYHKWAVYPQASFTYSKTSKHQFQISLATDKTYPSYWDMQSFVTYLNGYSELQGTPGLRPMTSYNLNGSYILKQKYIFGLFFTHTSDYFAQVPYQATDRLALIYKNTNWDFMRMAGINAVIPFSVGKWHDAHLTLVGMQTRQKNSHFFDCPFDRKKWVFIGTLNNTFRIGNNLSFELNGNVQTPFIQGTLDLASSFNLTAGMKWDFAKGKCSVTAQCEDLFNASMPDMTIRFNGQHLNMNTGYYTRSVTLSFTYRFGGYKKKEVKSIDTSRFGF